MGVVLGLVTIGHAALFATTMVDDAWISFRYARNLVDGLGLVFNPGDVPVAGFTNPAWVLLAAAAHGVGLPVEATMKGIGAVSAGLTTALLVVRVRRFERTPTDFIPTGSGLTAGALLAISTGLATYAVTGLETALYGLFMLLSLFALLDRRPVGFGVFTALAFLTRPEAGLMGVAGVALLALRPASPERRVPDLVRASVTMSLLVGPYLVFAHLTFGTIFPNTLLAKHGSLADGVDYVAGVLGPMAALVLAAALSARRPARAATREVLSLWFLYAASVVVVGGDWMPAGRMLVPTLPWLLLAAEPMLLEWVDTCVSWRARGGRDRVLAILGLVLLVPYVGYQVLLSHSFWVSVDPWHEVADARRELAERWKREAIASVACVDIGLVGWAYPDVDIVDLGGLTDPEIARTTRGHLTARPDPDYLERRAPALVVLTSREPDPDFEPQFDVERHLLRTAWLRDRYRPMETVRGSDDYWMHVFARREGGQALPEL
jgi:hypothetical protein